MSGFLICAINLHLICYHINDKLRFEVTIDVYVMMHRVARKYWLKSLQEYFSVDSSAEMNELAKLLLKGGDTNAQLPTSGLYYRQFLSAAVSVSTQLLHVIITKLLLYVYGLAYINSCKSMSY